MSLGVIAGFILAYPANVWLVSKNLKHGLMTERKPGSRSDLGASMVNGDHALHHGKPAKQASAMDHQRMMGENGGHSAQHGGDTGAATWPQLASVSFVSLFALITGMIAPANWVNMTLSAREVGSIIMPRGMIMDRDTPADAMRDMAFADPRYVKASYGIEVKGDQDLPFRMENGVKVFELRPAVIRWTILPSVTVHAYAYNA